MKTYWISFAQIGGRNLGICIVEAEDPNGAIEQVILHKLFKFDPTVDVEVIRIEDDGEDVKNFPKNKFIPRDEVLKCNYQTTRVRHHHCPHQN